MVNRAVIKVFRSGAFNLAVEEAVQKSVLEPQSVEAVATRMAYSPAFSVLVAIFINHEVNRCFLNKTKMKKRF